MKSFFFLPIIVGSGTSMLRLISFFFDREDRTRWDNFLMKRTNKSVVMQFNVSAHCALVYVIYLSRAICAFYFAIFFKCFLIFSYVTVINNQAILFSWTLSFRRFFLMILRFSSFLNRIKYQFSFIYWRICSEWRF